MEMDAMKQIHTSCSNNNTTLNYVESQLQNYIDNCMHTDAVLMQDINIIFCVKIILYIYAAYFTK